mgnify:CR=1 FL=1
MHVDMNYFFAAVEERERLGVKGKPIVVGADPKRGKGRGVVIATRDSRMANANAVAPMNQVT